MRVAALLIALPLAACGNPSNGGGTTADTTRDYPLSGFERIESAAPAQVRVTTGDRFAVRAEGNAELIQRLTVKVEGDTLRIGVNKQGWSWRGREDAARIAITMPRVTGATIKGAGDMTIDRGADDFTGDISGAGNLAVGELRGGRARFGISGAGSVAAAGNVDALDINVSGAGSVSASDLRARTANVRVAGTGSVEATVDGDADVTLTGIGSVDLGDRARCRIKRSGIGSVNCGG